MQCGDLICIKLKSATLFRHSEADIAILQSITVYSEAMLLVDAYRSAALTLQHVAALSLPTVGRFVGVLLKYKLFQPRVLLLMLFFKM